MKKNYRAYFCLYQIAIISFFSYHFREYAPTLLRIIAGKCFFQKRKLSSSRLLIVAISLFMTCCSSCTKQKPEDLKPAESHISRSISFAKIYINNIDQLYAAVNDPENDGKTLILAAGTYTLSPAYPKGGRLELRHNMSLLGDEGRPNNVIIDATQLPPSSLIIPPTPAFPATLRTAAVRMGNGKNSVEWITFQNNPSHSIRALIQTDLVFTMTAQIRIAHCVVKGSSIGISVINRDPTSSNREVQAEIEDNELVNNIVPQFAAGILIGNTMEANDAVIRATLRRNYVHGNKAGLLADNAGTEGSIIEIKSYADRFEANGMGLGFTAGFCEPGGVSLNDTIRFDAYGSSVRNNSGNPAPPFSYFGAGVYATGADAYPPFGLPGAAHHNTLEISFHGCDISGNVGPAQIFAYGGHSFFASPTPVGTYNSTAVYLYGLSAQASVQAINSVPDEPAGTNTVKIYRY